MGIGGGVIASFTTGVMQETKHQRYLHNQRILEEAKQALLLKEKDPAEFTKRMAKMMEWMS